METPGLYIEMNITERIEDRHIGKVLSAVKSQEILLSALVAII
jgi:hypothetical protein